MSGPSHRLPTKARLVRTGAVAILLSLHFLTRFHAHQVMPLQETHFYPTSYFVSLSLMAGRGFNYLLPASAGVSSPAEGAYDAAVQLHIPAATDAAEPVVGFILLRGPEAVSPQEFQRFLAAGTRSVPPDGFETTRILDIHLTALLWRLFGISWNVYFAFHAFLSTAANLSVFLVARKLSGSYGCGLAAGLGFLASPLEAYSFAWSVRDTAPLWFTSLALAVMLSQAEPVPGRSPRARLLGWFAVGVASLLGLGWRPDALLVPPLVLAGLVLILATRGYGGRQVLQAAGCFVLGCLAVRVLIASLGPERTSSGVVFHTAWYGEFSRSRTFHWETPSRSLATTT